MSSAAGLPRGVPFEFDDLERMRAARARRPVPLRAVALSFGALLVPAAAPFLFPSGAAYYEALLWLLALIPAFLLAYYRGWRGAATALAAGMAVLTVVQVAILVAGLRAPDWTYLFVVVSFYVAVSLAVGWVTELLHRSREQAEQLALTDELTGLPNRRHAHLFLALEFEAARRGRRLTVVLFDVDHLKEYNDRHGHAAGDEALRRFARSLADVTRGMNLSARFGGDEFLTILSAADAEGALAFVERVRDRLAAVQPAAGRMTISAGIAEYRADQGSVDELLAAADAALYAAKDGGADAVRVAEAPVRDRTDADAVAEE